MLAQYSQALGNVSIRFKHRIHDFIMYANDSEMTWNM